MSRLLLALTPGDPDGIGPEITWKILRSRSYDHQRATLLCIGAKAPFVRMGVPVVETSPERLYNDLRRRPAEPHVLLLAAPEKPPSKRVFLPGYQAGWSIETAVNLVRSGLCAALVTGPISKDRLQRGGFKFAGHTELLAALCKAREATMMMVNSRLRLSLVTVHVAIKDVARAITRPAIRRAVLHTATALTSWWGISRPRIAVAALNPHAGERGLLGKEEESIIIPAVRALQRELGARANITGPYPADTLFVKPERFADRFDAAVCMYHDQGLIPVKLLDFEKTVNVTLGLPLIRTSVDHGTGFDIAGLEVANPSSLQEAIGLAIKFSGANRTK